MRIAISGASGLIGSALTTALRSAGHDVLPLVRASARPDAPGIRWDPMAGTIDSAALEGLDAVVHLAGENIGKRWSPEQRRRIRESRVKGTETLAMALAGLAKKPKVFFSASAIGFYGDTRERAVDESAPHGKGFLAEVCEAWENAARPARDAGIRTVHPRFGLVVSAHGGALDKMIVPFKLGAGGRLGSGKQVLSWVALDDVTGALLHTLRTEALAGPVNVVSPNPVTNEVLAKALGRVLRRPALFPTPKLAIELALGKEMAHETALANQRVVPKKLLESGYVFRFPELEPALRHYLRPEPAQRPATAAS